LTASVTRQDFSIWMSQDTILTGSADLTITFRMTGMLHYIERENNHVQTNFDVF